MTRRFPIITLSPRARIDPLRRPQNLSGYRGVHPKCNGNGKRYAWRVVVRVNFRWLVIAVAKTIPEAANILADWYERRLGENWGERIARCQRPLLYRIRMVSGRFRVDLMEAGEFETISASFASRQAAIQHILAWARS